MRVNSLPSHFTPHRIKIDLTKIRPRLLRMALCLALALICLLSLPPARSGSAQRAVNPRFGLVNAIDAPQAAYDSGAGWEILTFKWDQLQPDGPTQWSSPPEIEEWLGSARAAGREVVGVLVSTPAWATDGDAITGVPRGLYLPVDNSGNLWANFVRRAVNYYGARGITRWVIWANPDIPPGVPQSQWAGSAEDYYQLVKVAYLVGKAANPNTKIHLGGVSYYDPGWFDRFLSIAVDDPTALANAYYFDVATLHVYYSPERVYTLMGNHFYLMTQKNISPLKEVWINETNARPAIDPLTYPAGTNFGQYPRITLEQQASFIVQAYALGFAANRGARIAVYRLADNLIDNDQQAFGLVRADGDPRPAFDAYRLVAGELDGFIYANRVDEQTHPYIDYVRLTSANKVTHVAWALSQRTATLIIPARSQQATLIDLQNNRWLVKPQNGEYRLVVGGADCNDPSYGCLIGGAPWILVEDGLSDPLSETPPPVTVELGGTLPTPDPSMAMTATAKAIPTATPTSTATATLTPTPQPPTATATTTPPPVTASPLPPVSETPVETPPSTATDSLPAEVTTTPPESTPGEMANTVPVQPGGLSRVVSFALVGLGVLVIAGGIWYFLSAPSRTAG